MKENRIKKLTILFTRDLDKLAEELNQLPDDQLWKSLPGVTNSCGVLAQHIVGNLSHYIGACLGNTGYERNRNGEFEDTGRPKSAILKDISKSIVTVEEVLSGLSKGQLKQPYQYFDKQNYTVEQFLIHLYGHLNYHLGQVNYLRRILSENNG